MHDVQHITVYIARRPAEVYEAAGLARSEVRRDGEEWVVGSRHEARSV
jgi:hypothetical protein